MFCIKCGTESIDLYSVQYVDNLQRLYDNAEKINKELMNEMKKLQKRNYYLEEVRLSEINKRR